jgi:hypothetical protein
MTFCRKRFAFPYRANYSGITPTIWKGNGMKLTANMDGIVIAAIALVMLGNLIHQLLA